MIIAVDGPAASGKGTLGRQDRCPAYGLAYLDTGAIVSGHRSESRAIAGQPCRMMKLRRWRPGGSILPQI